MEEILLREAREKTKLSLREAARRLRITHPYLSALELGHKPLRDDRREDMARLYKVSAKALTQPAPQNRDDFSKWLRAQVEWWDSRFVIPTLPGTTRLVRDLYVEPVFRLEHERRATFEELLGSFMQDSQGRALILTGDIGTGKSFFVRKLTVETEAICKLAGSRMPLVPALVSLSEFELQSGSLVLSLVNYYKSQGYEGSAAQLEAYLSQLLKKGQLLLMFDGLDEIMLDSNRVEMLARLQQQFEQIVRPSGSKLVITGRRYAFFERDRRYKGFMRAHMERWDEVQMFASCNRWAWENEAQGRRFWQIIRVNDALFDLASWPLLFHLLATLYSFSGAKPFQELSGLCDACCQVLEESWNSARSTFQQAIRHKQKASHLEDQSWLKWRHFLIHLMEGVLDQPVPKLSFTASEMRDAWESFLTKKGVSRDSRLFSRLEDLAGNQNRIGPLFFNRETVRTEEGTRIEESFAFLEPLFGYFYLAKALINRADRLPDFFEKKMLSGDWSNVLALALQELGRSDRTFECETGEKLLQLLAEKERQIDGAHGHTPLFIAMRAVSTFNMERFWSSIVDPFLNLYMSSSYERDNFQAFTILGEYGASASLRRFLTEKYQAYKERESPAPIDDQKWRIQAALAKLSEDTESVLMDIIRDIHSALSQDFGGTPTEIISTRRLFISLRYTGRLLMVDEENSGGPLAESISRLKSAIMDYAGFMVKGFEKQLATEKFDKRHPWDVLCNIVRTQRVLGYFDDLARTLELACSVIVKHFQQCFDGYPARPQLMQFLKAAARSSSYLPDKLSASLEAKLNSACEAMPDSSSSVEAKMITSLLSRRRVTTKQHFDPVPVHFEVFGKTELPKVESWIETIEANAERQSSDYLALGQAVWSLASPGCLLLLQSPEIRARALKALDRVLRKELSLDDKSKNLVRYYTRPYSDYGMPLYDHIYNSLVFINGSGPDLMG